MKILFCSSFVNTSSNGAAIFAQLFLEWCNERKITVDIISSEMSEPSFIPLVHQNKFVRKFPILNQYQRSFIYYKTVKEKLREKSYDLIFFNSVIESLHTAKLIKKTPVHAFLHDENFMKDYMKNAPFKRKIYRTFLFRQEQKACHFLDKVWTNSKYMKMSLDSIYNIHPVKSEYFYFRSFDLKKEVKKLDNNSLRILFIKHDYTRGGLIPLIKAINKIDKYPVILDVIGPPESKHPLLQKLMKDHTILISEYKDRKGIQQAFQQADLFCVPSYSEALGLGNLEALSLGIPVIASNIPVMNELNIEKIYHMLPSHEPSDIKNTIIAIMEDKTLQETKRNNGLKFIESTLSKEKVFQSFDSILR